MNYDNKVEFVDIRGNLILEELGTYRTLVSTPLHTPIMTASHICDQIIAASRMEWINYCKKYEGKVSKYKWVHQTYGITAKQIRKRFIAHYLEHNVDPIKDILEAVGVYIKTDHWVIPRIHKHKEMLRQVAKDCPNMFYICAILESSPQEAKKRLGKGLWKRLCANSKSRNKLIAKAYMSRSSDLDLLNKIPSTILTDSGGMVFDESDLWYINSRGDTPLKDLYKSYRESLNAFNYYDDTKFMAAEMQLPFSEKWSRRKMKEKHDEYTKEKNKQQYSDEEIQWLKDYNIPEEVYGDGFKATLLKSKLKVAEEGVAMGHCVAGYASRVEIGQYLVYSITNSAGDRASTLGLNLSDPYGGVTFSYINQHYGKYNERVTDEAEIALAKEVEKRINEQVEVRHEITPKSVPPYFGDAEDFMG